MNRTEVWLHSVGECYSQCSLLFLLSMLCCVSMGLGKIPLVYLLESAQNSFANAVSLSVPSFLYWCFCDKIFFLPTQYLDNEVYWLCLIEVLCTYTKEFWGKKVFTSPQKTCPGSLMCDMYVCSHSLWFWISVFMVGSKSIEIPWE